MDFVLGVLGVIVGAVGVVLAVRADRKAERALSIERDRRRDERRPVLELSWEGTQADGQLVVRHTAQGVPCDDVHFEVRTPEVLHGVDAPAAPGQVAGTRGSFGAFRSGERRAFPAHCKLGGGTASVRLTATAADDAPWTYDVDVQLPPAGKPFFAY